jgi:DNA-binding NtrC family response regulator
MQPAPTPIVALIRNDQDRELLREIAGREHLDIHFAETCGEAWNTANRLQPLVVLCERDVPGMQWQDAVRILASAAPHPCVILTSPVVDDYVWREIVTRGGYDVLARPLRGDDAVRAIRLALTYWKNTANLRK